MIAGRSSRWTRFRYAIVLGKERRMSVWYSREFAIFPSNKYNGSILCLRTAHYVLYLHDVTNSKVLAVTVTRRLGVPNISALNALCPKPIYLFKVRSF